jgi:hypothetical protein
MLYPPSDRSKCLAGHRKPLARYGAIRARSLAAGSAELHHHRGPDPRLNTIVMDGGP